CPNLAGEWPAMTQHGAQYTLASTLDGSVAPEWFFELVRRAEFSERPSRFESVFAFETLFDARAFRHSYGGNNSVPILRVEGSVAHRANMNLVRWTSPSATTLARAREYWLSERGLATPLRELLLAAPVTVDEAVAETEPS
ncbi:MAG: hypothetical protein ACYDHT_13570, partial [Solirubrobacteraceae bacterium]